MEKTKMIIPQNNIEGNTIVLGASGLMRSRTYLYPSKILGYKIDKDELIVPQNNITGHTIVIGKAGSMKTVAYAIPNVLLSIELGESMVISDMNNEIHAETKNALKENGYEIKELNTITESNINKIDFSELGKKKCAYFISDNKSSENKYDIISNLYLTAAFKELIKYADSIEEENLPARIKFIIDDFEAVKAIDNFGKILSTITSRNIDISILVQSVNFLKSIYGENQAEEILSNCFTKLFFSDDYPYLDEYLNKNEELNKEMIVKSNDKSIVIIAREKPVIANKK